LNHLSIMKNLFFSIYLFLCVEEQIHFGLSALPRFLNLFNSYELN
jgi:hypothetical protein